MGKTITAVLIDPNEGTLTTVQWDQKLDSLYTLLKCQAVEAHTILTLGDPVTVWVDEEYWVRAPFDRTTKHKASVLPSCVPLCGRMLITGETDGEGGVISCPMPVSELRELVLFVESKNPHA